MSTPGKQVVAPGGQAQIDMGYTATPVSITNLDNGNNATVLYAWIYNDVALISNPVVASPPNVELNAGGARTIMPQQKTGSDGKLTDPRTFVIFNEGPGQISVEKLI